MVTVCCLVYGICSVLFFFLQEEDGIRDVAVTGVQTCALPIWYVAGNVPPRVRFGNMPGCLPDHECQLRLVVDFLADLRQHDGRARTDQGGQELGKDDCSFRQWLVLFST